MPAFRTSLRPTNPPPFYPFMKKLLILAPLALATFCFTGCGDCCSSHGPDTGAATTVLPKLDTRKVEQAFASAEQGVKSAADKAIAAVKNADYSVALAEAQKLLNDVKLTPEQKAALDKLVEQVKSAAGEVASKAADAVGKAASDLKADLPVRK